MSIPVGTKIIHKPTDIVGYVVENYKFHGDICVDWENGQRMSYDEDMLLDADLFEVILQPERINMLVTGYQLREALRRAVLERQVLEQQFTNSLYAFEGQNISKPMDVIAAFRKADEKVAGIQELQQQYNQSVAVKVGGRTITLALAVKLIGGAGRVEKMLRSAATGGEKNRYSYNDQTRQRDKDTEYAQPQITQEQALAEAQKAATYAGQLRAAIAKGNNTETDLKVAEGLLD